MSKGLQIAIGAVLVAGVLGWYGWSALGSNGTYRYYQTLDEFRQAGVEGPARVHGYVAVGSIQRDLATRTIRFEVQGSPPHAGVAAGTRLEVSYDSLDAPDLFKDGAEVVIEGQISPDGGRQVFHATKLFAKCPSKFRAKTQQAAL